MHANGITRSFQMSTRYHSPRDITALCALQNEDLAGTPTGHTAESMRSEVDTDIEYYCSECDESKCICEWADAYEDLLVKHLRHIKRRWPLQRSHMRQMLLMQRTRKAAAKKRTNHIALDRTQRAADLGT
jgi:hypothetical protein